MKFLTHCSAHYQQSDLLFHIPPPWRIIWKWRFNSEKPSINVSAGSFFVMFRTRSNDMRLGDGATHCSDEGMLGEVRGADWVCVAAALSVTRTLCCLLPAPVSHTETFSSTISCLMLCSISSWCWPFYQLALMCLRLRRRLFKLIIRAQLCLIEHPPVFQQVRTREGQFVLAAEGDALLKESWRHTVVCSSFCLSFKAERWSWNSWDSLPGMRRSVFICLV